MIVTVKASLLKHCSCAPAKAIMITGETALKKRRIILYPF